MKSLVILLLSSLLLAAGAYAQKPETIHSFARIQMPLSWYKTQAVAWKKAVDKNPKDAKAWYNYYRVNRNLRYLDTTDARTPEERSKSILQLVDNMGKQIPNTYEFNLCKWLSGGNDYTLLPYLKKADELGQGRYEYLDNMVTWGETDRDLAKRDAYCKRWKETGQVSAGLLYYNYNVLAGLPQNAILLTSGDNDTYPAWILQSEGIRRDVTVINTSLILLDDYRHKLFAELGAGKLDLAKDASGNLTNDSYVQFDKSLVEHLTHNKKQYPVFVSLTTAGCSKYTEHIQENLYLTGLTYRFSKEAVDNLATMKRNFEQLYTLDYLNQALYTEISTERVKEMNRNYVVPMLKLYDHYKMAGDSQHENWIKDKLAAVSKGTEEELEIKKHLD